MHVVEMHGECHLKLFLQWTIFLLKKPEKVDLRFVWKRVYIVLIWTKIKFDRQNLVQTSVSNLIQILQVVSEMT
jgi:hypothetical protein